MSLLEFPVFNLTGHASQTYTVTVSGDAPPHLTVTCPAEVTRGTDIDCAISISDSTLPFTITDLSARVVTRSAEVFETLHLPMPGTIPAGHVYHLRGPAVTTTMLTASASVTVDGQPIMLGGQAQFRVDPRPMEHEPYIMQLRPQISGPGGTTAYPRLGAATFGLYQSRSPDWNDIKTATVTSGPNTGLSYVLSIPGIPASLIYLTFAMFPGDPWYEAHPVHAGPLNDLGRQICTQSKIDRLRLDVERHEGVTLADSSHYGIDQKALRDWQLNVDFGGLVVNLPGSPQLVRQQMALKMATEWKMEREYVREIQDAFDSIDTPAILHALGCSIYLKI